MKDNNRRGGVIVDAHVHLYDCFEIHEFLSAALENLRLAARDTGFNSESTCVLLLAETPRECAFQRLLGLTKVCHQSDAPGRGRRWYVEQLPNDEAGMLATDDTGNTLIVIAGRQIVSSEGLEVLALATNRSIESGRSLRDSIQMINSVDAIAVVPWGVGKWLGQRGKVVRRYIESANRNDVFLGDISGRPSFWPRSDVFRLAESRGIRVLPGTDPLPLRSETRRAGSCGFHIDHELSLDNPTRALKKALSDDTVTIREHVYRESTWRFFYNQLRIRRQ